MEPIKRPDFGYLSLNRYFREKFGARVQKLCIDAGFTCPNRDGSVGVGGCIYCNNEGFSPATKHSHQSVSEQVIKGIRGVGRKYGTKQFFAYFQAYTNTYAPVERLKSLYDEATGFPEVIGLCIGTRADCLSEEVLDLLDSYAQTRELWLELGLQSKHDGTLKRINRGHDFETFVDTVSRVKKRNLKICAHIIFGLPGEDESMMMETVDEVKALGIDGVKFHALHVLKDTELERMHHRGEVELLEQEQYVHLVVKALRRLPLTTVIHRLAADAPRDLLVAPEWCINKADTIGKIQKCLSIKGQV